MRVRRARRAQRVRRIQLRLLFARRGRECAGSGRLEGFGEGGNASPGAEGVRGKCGTRPGPAEGRPRWRRRPRQAASRVEPSRTASARAKRGATPFQRMTTPSLTRSSISRLSRKLPAQSCDLPIANCCVAALPEADFQIWRGDFNCRLQRTFDLFRNEVVSYAGSICR